MQLIALCFARFRAVVNDILRLSCRSPPTHHNNNHAHQSFVARPVDCGAWTSHQPDDRMLRIEGRRRTRNAAGLLLLLPHAQVGLLAVLNRRVQPPVGMPWPTCLLCGAADVHTRQAAADDTPGRQLQMTPASDRGTPCTPQECATMVDAVEEAIKAAAEATPGSCQQQQAMQPQRLTNPSAQHRPMLDHCGLLRAAAAVPHRLGQLSSQDHRPAVLAGQLGRAAAHPCSQGPASACGSSCGQQAAAQAAGGAEGG